MNRSKNDYNLIWRHTHRDYRGVIDGQRTILVFRNGSQLVLLTSLTDEEFSTRLASAKTAEQRRKGNVSCQ
jgi:hypothetical protein